MAWFLFTVIYKLGSLGMKRRSKIFVKHTSYYFRYATGFQCLQTALLDYWTCQIVKLPNSKIVKLQNCQIEKFPNCNAMNTVLIAGDVISKNYAKCSCILHLRVLGSGFDQEWIVFAKWNFLNSASHRPLCPMVSSSLGGVYSTMDCVLASHPAAPGFNSQHSQRFFLSMLLTIA